MVDLIKKETTSNEALIAAQIANSGPKDARSTGILKAEQPVNEDVPDTAELVRGYWKWTDNSGNFHKVPIDGTTAIREPAHEQHELTVENRDRLYQALALKTPRRDNSKAEEIHALNVRNDDVHDALQGPGVKPEAKEKGGVKDDNELLLDETEVKVGTPARY